MILQKCFLSSVPPVSLSGYNFGSVQNQESHSRVLLCINTLLNPFEDRLSVCWHSLTSFKDLDRIGYVRFLFIEHQAGREDNKVQGKLALYTAIIQQ